MKMEHMMEQRMNVNFCVELQKSLSETLQTLNSLWLNPQAKEAIDVKVKDQNNVGLLFRHQGYHAL
jgi:hypothetical protein